MSAIPIPPDETLRELIRFVAKRPWDNVRWEVLLDRCEELGIGHLRESKYIIHEREVWRYWFDNHWLKGWRRRRLRRSMLLLQENLQHHIEVQPKYFMRAPQTVDTVKGNQGR